MQLTRPVLAICLAIGLAAATADAQQGGKKAPKPQLIIETASESLGLLTITGTNFGSGEPLVTLGDPQVALTVTSPPGVPVITALTGGALPRSYLLTVSRGPSTTDLGVFEMTLGAVGETGADGADGADGDDGAPGAPGADGDPGVSGYQLKRQSINDLTSTSVLGQTVFGPNASGLALMVVDCGSGKKALGGGHSISDGANKVYAADNEPWPRTGANAGQGWRVLAQSTDGGCGPSPVEKRWHNLPASS